MGGDTQVLAGNKDLPNANHSVLDGWMDASALLILVWIRNVYGYSTLIQTESCFHGVQSRDPFR